MYVCVCVCLCSVSCVCAYMCVCCVRQDFIKWCPSLAFDISLNCASLAWEVARIGVNLSLHYHDDNFSLPVFFYIEKECTGTYIHTYLLKKRTKILMLVVDFGKLRNVVCYCHVYCFLFILFTFLCVLSSTKGI